MDAAGLLKVKKITKSSPIRQKVIQMLTVDVFAAPKICVKVYNVQSNGTTTYYNLKIMQGYATNYELGT